MGLRRARRNLRERERIEDSPQAFYCKGRQTNGACSWKRENMTGFVLSTF